MLKQQPNFLALPIIAHQRQAPLLLNEISGVIPRSGSKQKHSMRAPLAREKSRRAKITLVLLNTNIVFSGRKLLKSLKGLSETTSSLKISNLESDRLINGTEAMRSSGSSYVKSLIASRRGL